MGRGHRRARGQSSNTLAHGRGKDGRAIIKKGGNLTQGTQRDIQNSDLTVNLGGLDCREVFAVFGRGKLDKCNKNYSKKYSIK